MGGDEHDAELVRREHHRGLDVAGKVRQPLRVTGVWKAGEMQRMLVRGRGDDRIGRSRLNQADGPFHRVAGQPAGAKGPGALVVAGCRLAPAAHSDPPRCREIGDLLLRPEHDDLGGNRLGQRFGNDLGTDSPRVPEGNNHPWQRHFTDRF
jgi:hypothetical protein